jgi:hypothetical protein
MENCDDMDTKKHRLKKLIEHWIEHNEAHATRYNEAAYEADELGQKDVANELRTAFTSSKQVSKHLQLAKDQIQE